MKFDAPQFDFNTQQFNTTAPFINLNNLQPGADGGFIIYREGQLPAVIRWDESLQKWLYGILGYEQEMGSGGGGETSIVPLFKKIVLAESASSFDIGFNTSNKSAIVVFRGGTYQTLNEDYIMEGSVVATPDGSLWPAGTMFEFLALSAISSNANLHMVRIDSSFTAAEATTHCLLNTVNYNHAADTLDVYHEGILLNQGVQYSINEDNLSIELIGWSLQAADSLTYHIWKAIGASGLIDGADITAGTVRKTTLTQDVQDTLTASDEHIDATAAHSATSAPTPERMMARDIGGRAQVAAPVAAADIARKAEVDGVQTNLTNHVNDAAAHGLGEAIVNTPSIGIGANTINYTGKIPVIPEINFGGMAYINLLGKDGNCEDTTKWSSYLGTPTLDPTTWVFGANCIKLTITAASSSNVNKNVLDKINPTKYYMLSGYSKNGNLTSAPRIGFQLTGAPSKVAAPITGTGWVRQAVKLSPTDMVGMTNIIILGCYVGGGNTAGQYCYMDGMMLNEITASDYNNLTEAQLLAKYPYVESYGCLTNPYFENRHYNIIRNGNKEEGVAWWVPAASYISLSIVNEKFRVTSSDLANNVHQRVKLKANTNYYLTGIVTNGTQTGGISAWSAAGSLLKSGVGTFNTGNNVEADIALSVNGTGYVDFDSIMLIEGTTAPAEYTSCEPKAFVIEGQFTDDDQVTLKGGKLSGQFWWNHSAPLYGRDFNWTISGTGGAGYKYAYVPAGNFYNIGPANGGADQVLIRWDGSVCTYGSVNDHVPDRWSISGSDYILRYLLPNTETGFVDAVNASNDELRVFMNGWKALTRSSVTNRYDVWANVTMTDYASNLAAYPPGTATTVAMVTDGSANVMVADITPFKIGDVIDVYGWVGNITIGNIVNGNTLILNGNCPAGAPIGRIVIRHDNQTTHDILNWCKNNVAPGYEGYKVHYKLANPEPITDVNVHIQGELWDIKPGDNYVDIECGMVIDEIANPVYFSNTNLYYINNVYRGVADLSASQLRNKAERIFAAYKNAIPEINATIIKDTDSNAYGRAEVTIPQALFDTTAAYTVDYQILNTLHAQSFGTLSISYAQDVFTAVSTIAQVVEDKQQHDTALDTLADLSVYERIDLLGAHHLVSKYTAGASYLSVSVPFSSVKKAMPIVSIKIKSLVFLGGYQPPLFTVTLAAIYADRTRAQFVFAITDASAIATGTCSVQVFGEVIADCRGRI